MTDEQITRLLMEVIDGINTFSIDGKTAISITRRAARNAKVDGKLVDEAVRRLVEAPPRF